MSTKPSIPDLPVEIEFIIDSKNLTAEQRCSPAVLSERAQLLVDNGVFGSIVEAQDFVRMWFGALATGSLSAAGRTWISDISKLYVARREVMAASAAARGRERHRKNLAEECMKISRTIAAQENLARGCDAAIIEREQAYLQVVVGDEATYGNTVADKFAMQIFGAREGAKFIRERVLPGLEKKLKQAQASLASHDAENG